MSATRLRQREPDQFSPEESTVGPIPLSWAVPRKQWLLPVVAVVCVGLLGFGVKAILNDSTRADNALVYYTVKRGTLPIVVVERGNLESQITEEVICDVENFGGDRTGQSGTQILSIVSNGSSVKKGDLLVELDAGPLKDRLDTQFLSLQRAEAEMIQANVRHKNQITQNETALEEAKLRVELADLDVESYEDEAGGTFQIEMQNVEMDIQKARAQQMISQKDFKAVETLYDLGYKTSGDLASAKLGLLRADSDLASQLARKRQLEVYNYKMEKLSRKGKLDTAERSLDQVKLNNESDLAQALAAKDSADRAYEKEKERFDRYTAQLEKCKILAPQDGMVAYATSEGRYSRGSVIEEGAFVRERQKILTLPNLSRMQVNTAVHESVLDQVKLGLPATIRVDAFPDRSYRGAVKTVAVLPDQGGWMASDTKVYKTIVTIDEDVTQLKPGMTAVVEIDVERLENVISIPIQGIVQRSRANWCYVRVDGSVVKRKVTLGKTNDKFVEIKTGVEEGESVVLNPMSLVDEQGQEEDSEASEDEKKAKEDGTPSGERGSQFNKSGPGARGDKSGRGSAEEGKMPRGGRAGPGGRGQARGGGGFMSLDKDGDGKISKDEAPEQMKGMFDRLDKNSDGLLEASEMSFGGRGNTSGGRGDPSGMRGNPSGMRGDPSNKRGDPSGMRGKKQ